MNKPEAIQFADDRPSSCNDDLYQWAIDAEDMIRVMQSRIEALEKDAARYRWLRRKVCIVGGKFHILNLDPRYIAPDAAIELDSAIDAAMQSEKGGE